MYVFTLIKCSSLVWRHLNELVRSWTMDTEVENRVGSSSVSTSDFYAARTWNVRRRGFHVTTSHRSSAIHLSSRRTVIFSSEILFLLFYVFSRPYKPILFSQRCQQLLLFIKAFVGDNFLSLLTFMISWCLVRSRVFCSTISSAHIIRRSWVSSGSIVSDYGLDDRAIGVRSLAGAKNFSSSLCVQTGSGAHPASCTMCCIPVINTGTVRSGELRVAER
jgi:hypothetical protein